MDKQEKLITIMTVALLVLVAVIVVLIWGGYSNWFKTKFEYIYLTSNGERLQQSDVYRLGNVDLKVKQFGCKTGYTVQIEAVSDEDFVFTVDGKHYNYLDEVPGKDLTAAFNIEMGKRSMLLHARNVDVIALLESLYPDSDVQLVSPLDEPVLLKMTVLDEAGKHAFELTFYCCVRVRRCTCVR